MHIEKSVTLDCSKFINEGVFYDELIGVFGFPNFFGRNIHALIDCLSGLRYPEEGMIKVNITKTGTLLLKLKNYSLADDTTQKILMFSVESVNSRAQQEQLSPPILLCLEK